MRQEYVQGFMDKCAEYGVNPEALVKRAQLLANDPDEIEDNKKEQALRAKAQKVNPAGKPEMSSVANFALCPLPGSWSGP